MRMHKRIAAVALGATFAVLAFVGPAVATWADSTYLDWNQAKLLAGNLASTNPTSPHGGYSSATAKCGVCHAVHNASSTGQALLHDTKVNACSYCHISNAVSMGLTQVYGGDVNKYLVDDTFNHSAEHGATCTKCHQVHAASNQMTLNSYLTQKILIGAKVQDLFDPAYDWDVASAPQPTDQPEEAITKWCTSCHAYYSTNPADSDTHVLMAQDDVTSFSGSTYCSSCHSSDRSASAWPHYTAGARFLTKAASTTQTPVSVSATETAVDGVCLKCHRNGTGLGVGLSY